MSFVTCFLTYFVFIHATAHITTSFGNKELQNSILLCGKATGTDKHILFICSSSDGHSDCFHFLAVMNITFTNIHRTGFCVNLCFFLGIYLEVELLDHMS